MPAARPNIGFLGTGIMGAPMARRLAEAGFPVRAWNRTAGKAMALAASGIEVAGNAAEAVHDADVVICMLSSGPVCEAVLGGPEGAIASMRVGSILVVMSSVPVEMAQAQSEACARRGIGYVDAPVSGGERGARDGTLAIMAGGALATVAALAPIFEPLGRSTHVGPVGSGQLAKLANQLIVASNICAVAEALLMAGRGGADPAKVREALLGGFADSTVLRQHGDRMIRADYEPGGPAKYQVKDTSTALRFAGSVGLSLPLATTVDHLFRSLVDQGGGDLDHSAVFLELERLNRRETQHSRF